MRQFIHGLLLLIFISARVQAQSNILFDKLLFIQQKDTLPYRLLKPVNPKAEERFPLIIFLHGSGERGNDNEAQIRHITNLFLDERNRGKYPCYVVAPQCPKNALWASYGSDGSLAKNPTTPMKMMIALLSKIAAEFPIDSTRIYITGLSMGGYGTWDLIARMPEKFAAAIPICGGGDPRTATRIRRIPIWAFHGAKDDRVPPKLSRAMVRALQEAGGAPGYTEYPDIEHNSWVQAYQEPHLLPWLFNQRLPGSR
jgi:predicted peptidase